MKRFSQICFIRNFIIFLLFSFSPGIIPAVGYAPVRNFTPQIYNSGTQNWAMTQDSEGRIYVANRDGLLRFNGARWTRVRLPNFTTVRSLYIDEKKSRLYVGGSGELGFFKPSLSRQFYTSLVGLIPPKERDFSEIWNIFPDEKGNIWFQGDFRMYRYDGKNIHVIPLRSKITTSILNRETDEPLLALESGEIMRIRGDKVAHFTHSEKFHGKRIVGILIPGGEEEKMIIATAFHGLYLKAGDDFVPFNSDINDFLKENQLFCAANNGEDFAFGTVNLGAVLINFRTGKTTYINRHTGLQNNTVLNMGFDRNNCLWLCLDSGVSLAMTDYPLGNLLGTDHDMGAGYVSIHAGNKLLLGTNQALFSLPYPLFDSPLPPTPEKIMNGQIWSLDTIGNTLFIGADTGLFTASVNGAVKPQSLEGIPGTWMVKPLHKHPGYAIASTYDRFHLLKLEQGHWTDLGKIEGYNDAGGRFIEDKDGNIWLPHWLKGVYRLRPDVESRRFSECSLINHTSGLPSDRNNSVALYAGRVVITGDGGIYKIGPDGKVIPDNEIFKTLPITTSFHLYTLPEGRMMAISPELTWMLDRDSKGEYHVDSTSYKSISRKILPGFEHVGTARGNIIVSNQEGFMVVNPEKKVSKTNMAKVLVDAVYANQDSLVYRAGDDQGKTLRIPYQLNSLRIEYALPEYRDENGALYSCRLENYDDEWSPYSESTTREYTHLREGQYTLQLRALNPVTGEVSQASFGFEILPPWYRSAVAYIIYAVLAILVLFQTSRMLRKASLRAARRIEMRKEEEISKMKEKADREALQKDYEIAALKSEQLEHDIKHKSSELSNTTMNVIRKNEILMDISSRLAKLLTAAKSRGETSGNYLDKDIERIQRLIRENISHDDDWKNYNQNFDIVYANFTKRLTELHPDLTKTELRICCLLKMGLSSKEIAPLFNISPRSVEMSRYRIRKKLGLERSDNLNNYLHGISDK